MAWKKAKHKFNAKSIEHDGIRFDSLKEGRFYKKLKVLQESGEVVGFLRQVPLHLPGGVRYVMDFLIFYSDGRCEGVEVKGFETPEWKIKKKIVDTLYPWLEIRIVK